MMLSASLFNIMLISEFAITQSELNATKEKNNSHMRLLELLQQHSKNSRSGHQHFAFFIHGVVGTFDQRYATVLDSQE
jgi:hypothetical protein